MLVLPDIPKRRDHETTIIIALTVLSKDALEELKQQLADRSDDTLEDVAFALCEDNVYQRHHARLRRDGIYPDLIEYITKNILGSISDIFSIVARASMRNWWRVLIVDPLTRDHLLGKVRPGRSPEISVILAQEVAVDERMNGKRNGGTAVMAKRMHPREALRVARNKTDPGYFDRSVAEKEMFFVPQTWYHSGLMLMNHNNKLYDNFSHDLPNVFDAAQRHPLEQVLSRYLLPTEIALKIYDYCYQDIDLDVLATPPRNADVELNILPVQSLKPMSHVELKSLESTLNERLLSNESSIIRSIHCSINPWRGQRTASRHDIWRLYERAFKTTRSYRKRVFFYLGWAGWDIMSGEIGLLQWQPENSPPPTQRIAVERAAELWSLLAYGNEDRFEDWNNSRDNQKPVELFVDPRARFYFDPPTFVRLDAVSFPSVPVFFLTKHLDDTERKTVKEELYESSHDYAQKATEEGFIFGDWDNAEDGGESDMWRLLWQVFNYSGHGSSSTVLFIDKKSPVDKKIILASVQ